MLLDRSSPAIQAQFGGLDRLAEFARRASRAGRLACGRTRPPACRLSRGFILRNLEHVAVDEIAVRMGRSPTRCANCGVGP